MSEVIRLRGFWKSPDPEGGFFFGFELAHRIADLCLIRESVSGSLPAKSDFLQVLQKTTGQNLLILQKMVLVLFDGFAAVDGAEGD